ncbi:LysR family transcriptional regulator [Phaeobacter gallaeciensis]|uniref:LysR family transcriptional regulator n=2 Tax=Roseobacteraceae TaxID=2854170 RepID=A0A366WKJ0_9RHOB|nr:MULTISPECIES: transcriptional regulator GcvA [Roseobacteraceae]MBT3139777.1 transcriptional regulator GcvA [Falsiruegeria litorea]MBT8168059.1 transcriptional regulator GcvA [Falsiruegeria litorea]RBW50324.1 LysR family transcriptional regulator [Phaeobacter gallaeciensis]
MREMPPLNSLKAFEASGRHLNFSRAAEELGVTQGAIAQHVRALEALLKIKLFERRARGLSLTDEGRRYLPPVRRAFDLIAEATENLSPREAVVTISTTPSFATKWLVPRLGAFAQEHPDIRIRLDASNTLSNFQTDGVDIAIRLGTPPFGPGLVAEPLFASEVIAVCHPDLCKGQYPISAPQDLCHHVLLEDTHGRWPLFLEKALGGTSSEMRRITFSQTSLAIDAALAGQGVALTNRAFVDADLKANRLCQPVPFSMVTDEGFYTVAPRAPRNPTIVSDVRQWLVRQIPHVSSDGSAS